MRSREDSAAAESIGHFEQILLTAILTLGGESYGTPIYDRVCELAEKRVNLGSLYITLDRLAEKGLLVSWYSDPAESLRGRPKRYYRLEATGLRALEEWSENAKRLSGIIDDNSGSIRKWLRKREKAVRHNP